MLAQTRKLTTVLLLVVLVLGAGQALSQAAEDEPPGRLGSPVSLERGEILPAYNGCGGVYGVPSSNENYEQEVVDRVNAVRAQNGLPPLKQAESLNEAARYHAADMAQDDYFDHDTYDRSGGNLVRTCAWSERLQSYYSSWWALAENIAAGYGTPESVMNGWMNSSGHRANILSSNVWEIGVGYREGGSWGRYWVQDFGRRSGVYPLIINREARTTDSRSVSLYVYGDWQEMRLRNDNGSWTAWRPFQSTLTWDLPRQSGEHTIWAELRSGGTTTLASDTIVLTQSFTPILSNLPDDLSFTYSIPDAQLLPTAHQVTPQNAGSEDPLSWTVTADGGWFDVDPPSGTTPTSLSITPSAFQTGAPATYTGVVTVTVTDPTGVEGSPHRIDLTLRVTDAPLSRFHLPLVLRNYTPPPPARYPDDAFYGDQWALEKVDAPGAWSLSTGDGIVIAVLDTGVDLDHPDLVDKLRTDIDEDFVNGDDCADDDHGHGTHVAGIAAAATDNGTGVAGLGWDATILPLKVLDDEGNGDSLTLAAAIDYAVAHGADVINMSLGGAVPCGWTVQRTVNDAHSVGVTLIAAAGNNLGNTEMFPANCEHVLGVAATDAGDIRALYSNYGNHVSVAAPGSYVYNTLMGGSYDYMSGTSMATPHVAGLAALLHARYSSYTPDQIASAILDNAVDLDAAGWDPEYGCGRIDAFQALWTGAQAPSPRCLEGVGPWAAGVGETPTDAPFVAGEIIVAYRPGAEAETLSLGHEASAEFLPALDAWRLRVSPGQERAVLERLRADPAVAYADLNYLVSAQ